MKLNELQLNFPSSRLSDCYLFLLIYSGVPGVKSERFEEGMKIRHCALSLVGMML